MSSDACAIVLRFFLSWTKNFLPQKRKKKELFWYPLVMDGTQENFSNSMNLIFMVFFI